MVPTNLDAIRTEILKQHNIFRAQHGSPDLKLDETKNREAQAYAETISKLHKLKHATLISLKKIGVFEIQNHTIYGIS